MITNCIFSRFQQSWAQVLIWETNANSDNMNNLRSATFMLWPVFCFTVSVPVVQLPFTLDYCSE